MLSPHHRTLMDLGLTVVAAACLWVLVLFTVGMIAEKGDYREVFRVMFGIRLPHTNNLRYWFKRKEVRGGWNHWQNLHRRWKNSQFTRTKPGANDKAYEAVKKLAPEVYIVYAGSPHEELCGVGIVATRGYVDGECCSNTFHSTKDNGIPAVEKALNLYLWKKLFPKRWDVRPTRTSWGSYC
jgi:hypothetical protein